MKLFIKNMVCARCKMAVTAALEKLDIKPLLVELGEVTLAEPLTPVEMEGFQTVLTNLGFELITDKTSKLIEQIRQLLIELAQNTDADKLRVNVSVWLAEKLNKDYSYISSLFSSVEGQTIEQFLIKQKIEKVKELLVYDELTLSEVSYKLGYSSVAHLSNQFRKVTGLTPTQFKQLRTVKRSPLDEL